jgi:hypothetical protein
MVSTTYQQITAVILKDHGQAHGTTRVPAPPSPASEPLTAAVRSHHWFDRLVHLTRRRTPAVPLGNSGGQP